MGRQRALEFSLPSFLSNFSTEKAQHLQLLKVRVMAAGIMQSLLLQHWRTQIMKDMSRLLGNFPRSIYTSVRAPATVEREECQVRHCHSDTRK